jgi:hypothetical protein
MRQIIYGVLAARHLHMLDGERNLASGAASSASNCCSLLVDAS